MPRHDESPARFGASTGSGDRSRALARERRPAPSAAQLQHGSCCACSTRSGARACSTSAAARARPCTACRMPVCASSASIAPRRCSRWRGGSSARCRSLPATRPPCPSTMPASTPRSSTRLSSSSSDPLTAIRELTRVARRRVYVGVLNRWSLLGRAHGASRRAGARASTATPASSPSTRCSRMIASAGAARWRWGAVPYVSNRLSSLSSVQRPGGRRERRTESLRRLPRLLRRRREARGRHTPPRNAHPRRRRRPRPPSPAAASDRRSAPAALRCGTYTASTNRHDTPKLPPLPAAPHPASELTPKRVSRQGRSSSRSSLIAAGPPLCSASRARIISSAGEATTWPES